MGGFNFPEKNNNTDYYLYIIQITTGSPAAFTQGSHSTLCFSHGKWWIFYITENKVHQCTFNFDNLSQVFIYLTTETSQKITAEREKGTDFFFLPEKTIGLDLQPKVRFNTWPVTLAVVMVRKQLITPRHTNRENIHCGNIRQLISQRITSKSCVCVLVFFYPRVIFLLKLHQLAFQKHLELF